MVQPNTIRQVINQQFFFRINEKMGKIILSSLRPSIWDQRREATYISQLEAHSSGYILANSSAFQIISLGIVSRIKRPIISHAHFVIFNSLPKLNTGVALRRSRQVILCSKDCRLHE